ncbi:MAG: hypothetical protein ACRES9_02530 [Gammaproteobacteria bacterium]
MYPQLGIGEAHLIGRARPGNRHHRRLAPGLLSGAPCLLSARRNLRFMRVLFASCALGRTRFNLLRLGDPREARLAPLKLGWNRQTIAPATSRKRGSDPALQHPVYKISGGTSLHFAYGPCYSRTLIVGTLLRSEANGKLPPGAPSRGQVHEPHGQSRRRTIARSFTTRRTLTFDPARGLSLRDPGLREDIRLDAGEWIHDIAALPKDACPALAERGDGELAAFNWTAAQLAFARTRETPSARVLFWRFDGFLSDPKIRLAELAEHFGLEANATDTDHALSSP